MFDRIPFGGAGRVVANRDGDAVASGNFFVQGVFPEARPVTIASSAVAQEQDFFHAGISGPAELRNPRIQAIDGKLGSVRRETNNDGAAIPNRLKEPVRRSNGRCVAPEIVLVDVLRSSSPGGSRISEVADEFLLLRVYAQDGIARILESFSEV